MLEKRKLLVNQVVLFRLIFQNQASLELRLLPFIFAVQLSLHLESALVDDKDISDGVILRIEALAYLKAHFRHVLIKT